VLSLTKTFMPLPGQKHGKTQTIAMDGHQAALAQFTDALR
jgi:hypothetical protein